METVLKAWPRTVQVKHRGVFVPPRYELFKTDISASLAANLAATYNLRSTALIVNQNSASTQFLSFRYFLTGEPFRFFDAYIGIDQTELSFSNPATIGELQNEVGKFWQVINGSSPGGIASSYFEAHLQCDTSGVSTTRFLNDLVNVVNDDHLQKGFSVTLRSADAVARIALDVSEPIQDGLYVVFAFFGKNSIGDMSAFERSFGSILAAYRNLQNLAHIELVEP
jgi:hypothetical protein